MAGVLFMAQRRLESPEPARLCIGISGREVAGRERGGALVGLVYPHSGKSEARQAQQGWRNVLTKAPARALRASSYPWYRSLLKVASSACRVPALFAGYRWRGAIPAILRSPCMLLRCSGKRQYWH